MGSRVALDRFYNSNIIREGSRAAGREGLKTAVIEMDVIGGAVGGGTAHQGGDRKETGIPARRIILLPCTIIPTPGCPTRRYSLSLARQSARAVKNARAAIFPPPWEQAREPCRST